MSHKQTPIVAIYDVVHGRTTGGEVPLVCTRVLLIEDSDVDAMLVQAQLRDEKPSCTVTRVETLLRGCERLCQGDTDVIILDLNLPDSMGIESFTIINRRFPHVPVVILSGRDDETLALDAINCGAQDYVTKRDVNGKILTRSLRYAIERNARLLVERRNHAMNQDLAAAQRIQQHLLPKRSPHIPGFDLAAICQPAEATGGDFFDFIPLINGNWALLIADVSSHGFAPSLIMVGARRVFRTCAPMHDDIGQVLTIANHAVWEDTLDDQFVTVFLARLEPTTRSVKFAAAGHPAYMIRVDGEVEELDTPNLPLGILQEENYRTQPTNRMHPGDVLVLMTDGLWEANNSMKEQFSRDRVFEVIRSNRHRSALEIRDELMTAMRAHCRPSRNDDDVTLMLVKCLEDRSS